MSSLRNRATRAVARRRHRLPFRLAASAAALYLEMFGNVSYELELNGELRVLEVLARSRPKCVFDVGANVGNWTVAAARRLPEAHVHAFEVVPETAEVMRDRVVREGLPTVTVEAVGLSDRAGALEVGYVPGFSEASSAVATHRSNGVEWRECEVETGDGYCRERGIEHIDFLKLDVEGHEDKVLNGFESMLADGAIDAVQFEYGRVNATARFLLGDFYDLFDRHGYAVGKIFPDLVDFHAYDPWRDEDFRGPNYMAVHLTQTELIRRLGERD